LQSNVEIFHSKVNSKVMLIKEARLLLFIFNSCTVSAKVRYTRE